LRGFENVTGIIINWRMFGSAGLKNRTAGLVIERFKDASPLDFNSNRHAKSIVNPRKVYLLDIHWALYLDEANDVDVYGRVYDYDMRMIPPIHHRIRINHYWTKSYEEWLIKRARGKASTGEIREEWEWGPYAQPWGNQDTLIDKYIPLIKERLKARFGK
jgi:hypothetical protein